MSLFDINYNTKAIELSPPNKRGRNSIGFLQAFVAPIQYLRDKFLGDYRTGSTYSQWVPGSYNFGAKVIRKQKVYECLVPTSDLAVYDNTGTVYQPGAFVSYSGVGYVCKATTSGAFDISKWAPDAPPSDNWMLYLPSFIGVDTRVLFNGQLIVLTYALNDYFRTNFRQPGLLGWAAVADSTHSLYSDIYITNIGMSLSGFRVGQTEDAPNFDTSSSVAQNDVAAFSNWIATSYAAGNLVRRNGLGYLSLVNGNTDEPPSSKWHAIDTIGGSSVFVRSANFTINIPAALYNPLDPRYTNESEIRNFVDPLIPVGLFYTIATY